MKTTVVIMAGGKGERFWPRSRSSYPKQFLSLTKDKKTMIQLTVERLLPVVSIEDVFIVTNANYRALVHEQLPDLPVENILAEPAARNTAPCIGYAAEVIKQKYGDAVMVVLPSDHLIRNKNLYLDTLKQSIEMAQKDGHLVTIGITPTYPETGYGYINFAKKDAYGSKSTFYKVKRFVEKPSLLKAQEYLASEEYLWNSGMFVWKASTILENIKKYLPDIFKRIEKIGVSLNSDNSEAVITEEFQEMPSISIDFGVMEKAEHIYTVPGNFGWDDVGSWLALERFNEKDADGNVFLGSVVSLDAENNIVSTSDKTVALLGMNDCVVVQTDDVVLVCSKGSVNKIKEIVHSLKEQGHKDLL